MKAVRKISIVGVGLMGGSLAMAFKEKFPHIFISGYARSKKSFLKLKKFKSLDLVSMNLEDVLKNADIVVLGLPVLAIIDYLSKIAPFLKRGAIVFDLGSTKKKIEESAKKLLPRYVHFVGCHPLCGSEKRGFEFSQKDLYKGAICFVTSSGKSAKFVEGLWKKLGSEVFFITPAKHDKMLSLVSHIPHVFSYSLIGYVSLTYLGFSSPSLKSLSRISMSPSSVWVDIFLSNKDNIASGLKAVINSLEKFKNILYKGDKKLLVNFIKKANRKSSLMNR